MSLLKRKEGWDTCRYTKICTLYWKIVPLRKLKYIFYYKWELMLSAVSVEKEVFKIVTMGSRG